MISTEGNQNVEFVTSSIVPTSTPLLALSAALLLRLPL